jgi:predicted outer membrane repeat protein
MYLFIYFGIAFLGASSRIYFHFPNESSMIHFTFAFSHALFLLTFAASSNFTDNVGVVGGGIEAIDSQVDITDCSFTDNSADDSGGAILLNNCPGSSIASSQFVSNVATGGSGGAVNIGSSTNVQITQSIFQVWLHSNLFPLLFFYFLKISNC